MSEPDGVTPEFYENLEDEYTVQDEPVATNSTTNSLLTIVYQHTHECSRKDMQYTYRPICVDGVAMIVNPTCIETLIELEEISRSTD